MKNFDIKKIVSLSLVFVLLIMQSVYSFASTVSQADSFETLGTGVVASGNCGKNGNNLTWEITGEKGNYVLTIKGSGDMANGMLGAKNVSNAGRWEEYRDSIVKIKMSEGITSIGDYAFCSFAKLTSVTIPKNISSFGKMPFGDCSELSRIENNSNVNLDLEESALTSNTWINEATGDVITEIANGNAIWKNKDSGKTGAVASGYCGGEGDGTNLTWTLDSAGTLTISGTGKMKTYEIGTDNEAEWFSYGKIKKIIIGDGVKNIGDFAFSANYTDSRDTINEVIILGSVESIEMGAFLGDVGLKSITIPEGVITIGINAFEGCINLEKVTLPQSLNRIEEGAFYMCKIKNLIIPQNVSHIGTSAFSGIGIRYDNDSGYYNDPNGVLEKISVQKGNEYYDSRDNCNAIIETETNTLIQGCINTVVPEGVEIIGDCSFAWLPFETISLPGGIEKIGRYSFSDCGNLKEIVLPDSLSFIGEGAFSYCDSLNYIVVPKGLKEIQESAFSEFYECNSLKDVYFRGSKEEWNGIIIGEDNDSLTKATIHYNSCDVSIGIDKDGVIYCGEDKISNLKEISFGWSLDDLLANRDGYLFSESMGALCLASAAYLSSDEVDNMLLKLGLAEKDNDKEKKPNDWSRWKYAYDSPGVAHTFSIRKYGGKNIITITIRGSRDIWDWLVNVSPVGFKDTAGSIMNDLKEFLADRDLSVTNSNNFFFLTGHSMGGAVAGNMAKKLNLEEGISGRNIICYTFASPFNVYNNDDYYKNNSKLTFIHNVINTSDYVGMLRQNMDYIHARWGKDSPFSDFYNPGFIDWYKYLQDKNYYDFINSLANLVDRAIVRHKEVTYFALVLADELPLKEYRYRAGVVRCPVDVSVIDSSGMEIGSIVNNEVIKQDDNNVLMAVLNEDEKHIFFLDDRDYKLCFKGTNTGTMSYEFSDVSYSDNKGLINEVSTLFKNVSLEKGKSFQSDIIENKQKDGIELFVVDDVGKKLKRVLSDGKEEEIKDNEEDPSSNEKNTVSSMKIITEPKGTRLVVGDKAIIEISGIDPDNITTKGKAGTYKAEIGKESGKRVIIFSAEKKGSAKLCQIEGKKKKVKCVIKVDDPKIKNSIKIKCGKRKKLKLSKTKIKPDKWASSNDDVCSVGDDGTVTGKKAGSADVYAYIGEHAYKCNVVVK